MFFLLLPIGLPLNLVFLPFLNAFVGGLVMAQGNAFGLIIGLKDNP